MNVLSLFSGIGGLDLGLEWAGMTTVGQVEIDPYCQQVLAKHWPEVPKHDDVRTCAEWWRSAPRPRVDLIAGGFPCQGHSVAGKQRGTTDERWGWPAFRRVAQAIRPPLILIENVPNLTRTGLLDVIKDLAGDGFDAWWFRVSAAAVGAPHLRWRLFVIAAHPQRIQLRHEPGRSGGQDGADQTVTGFDGATWALADYVAHTSGVNGGARRAGRPALYGNPQHDQSETRLENPACPSGTYWPPEPPVGRVAYGVPSELVRPQLTALGNAVVPQVGEYVGRLIMDAI